MTFTTGGLEQSLEALGELLESRGQGGELVAIGGGSLLLLGLIGRPTKDLDIVALVEDGVLRKEEPLPDFIVTAVQDVALAMGLADDWLNPGPSELFTFGLPSGFMARVETRTYGSVVVHIAGRTDQIHLKLYAAVDQGPGSKHFADL
ncbi:MAG: hypothetical protein MK135_09320, partial [Polyangiaceae bacterium]|nr:hypothetical protein [Polyangiaceae bacterium]